MYLLNKVSFARILVIIGSVLALNGCLLTDAFKQELIDKNTQTDLQKKIGELEETYTLQELTRRINNIEKITPEISRVMELESDLAYLTEMMKSDRQGISSINRDTDILVDEGLPSLEVLAEADFLPNVRAGNNQVELAAASPLVKPLTTLSSEQVVSIDDKFSSSANTNVNNMLGGSERQSQTNSNIEDKFTQARNVSNKQFSSQIQAGNSRPSDIVGPTIDENTSNACYAQAADGGKHSIHLASYITKANAISGWNKLMNKHDSLLCNLTPKLANVSVKGTDYLSLRVGPLSDKTTALKLCAAIKATGDYCASAEYHGTQL
ncbi:MAG: SPOR domain-containing protein [Glaciecola sp.]